MWKTRPEFKIHHKSSKTKTIRLNLIHPRPKFPSKCHRVELCDDKFTIITGKSTLCGERFPAPGWESGFAGKTKLIKNRPLRNPDTINPAHNTIWAMGSKHTPPRPSRPAHTARSQNKVTQKYTIQSFKVGQTPGFLSP